MEKTFQFKTNINCGGCVARVKSALDQADGVCHWEVDTLNPDKILTVHATGITAETIVETVREKGFQIQNIDNKNTL